MKMFLVITQAFMVPPYTNLHSRIKFFYENRVRLLICL
jgi:hypothetical protein